MFQMQLPNFIIKAGLKEEFAMRYLDDRKEQEDGKDSKNRYIVLLTIDYLDGDQQMFGITVASEEAMERHIVNLLISMREEFDEQNT